MNRLLILPGFSRKNNQWALDIQNDLSPFFDVHVVEWQHWTEEKEDDWTQKEAAKIIEKETESFFVIAKSMGTVVASQIIQLEKKLIKKIIFCGFPLNDLTDQDKEIYNVLGTLNPENTLCIQNDKDPHGSFQKARDFLSLINHQISILNKDRDDHEYPYPQDFISFLAK